MDQSLIERKRRSRQMKKGNDSIPAFLLKTYDILENPIYSDVIGWNEDGSAFVVKKVNEFSELILPKSFKHSNFASFVRQLNMYDFHKTRHDNNENEFKHKLFRKGQKNLLSQIKRKTNEQKEQNSLSLIKNEVLLNGNGSPDVADLSMQMVGFLNKQNEMEKLIKIIIKQNEKYQKENKYLWNELMKNKQKQKNEGQQERLLMWFLQSLNPGKGQKIKNNQQMLMIKQGSEQLEDPMMMDSAPQFPIKNLFADEKNFESSLEGVSKKHILQKLMAAINQTEKKGRRKVTEDEISLASEDEYPPQKKQMFEPQLMLGYQDSKFLPEEQFIIGDYQEYLSRKDSYYDPEVPQQFFEEQI